MLKPNYMKKLNENIITLDDCSKMSRSDEPRGEPSLLELSRGEDASRSKPRSDEPRGEPSLLGLSRGEDASRR